jgi:hypothetical protein
MEYPKTLMKCATYQCGHTLRLTKTVHTEEEEECFVCWMYDCELCPDCKEQNARKYREVYAAIENPCYHLYTIVFKRPWPHGSGTMLFTEWVCKDDELDTTRFLVECDINHHGHMPVGLYDGNYFVPFSGYSAEYMQFLLRHDREAVQAEKDLQNTRVSHDWGV